MSKLRAAFDRAAAEQRAALVAYLTFGDPSPAASIELVATAARAGADVIELGVAFSDPSADGPSIQRAMERALAAGATLAGALDAVAELRARHITVPIVVFGYYHPIFIMGPDAFAARAAAAGADAALVVDLPLEHLAELRGLATIPLVAPTSTPERIARLSALHPPFVYYISVAGVTGVKAAAPVDPARLAQIRAAAAAPVAVGFGIRTAADAARFAALADGVVVGSALVDRAADGPDAIAAFVGELAAAMPKRSAH
ncbi:MAG TPA: tryptophan synthase subunit alpha [Kofleriaceae bacterium]